MKNHRKASTITLTINPAARPSQPSTKSVVYAATAISMEQEQLFLTFHKTVKGAVKQHIEFAVDQGYLPKEKGKVFLETLEQDKHGKNTPAVVLESLLEITGYDGYVLEFPLNE